MKIRIGIDMGIASVGWAVVAENYAVLEAGSNIFNSADASKNQERRSFRQMKRLHRRRHTRVKDFDKLWINYRGKLPEVTCNNQLELRVKGLKSPLTEEQLYSVLRNMLLHRGIAYLEDALDGEGAGKSDYESALLENQRLINENKFPCEIQYERLQKYGKYRGDITVKNDQGEKVILSNVYTVDSYKREIQQLFSTQKQAHFFLEDEFCEKYLTIFSRKREYYEGPGNELSRTDYGKYTTKIDVETGKYITEENIFEKLIGKCSVYPEERRAANASYTAQEFNVLNDLNNLVINGRKLTREEKEKIIKEMKCAKVVNVPKIIKKIIGENIETMTGARVDKNGKEEFHHFAIYNAIRKDFEKNNLSTQHFSREIWDKIGDILTLNTEKKAILDAFEREDVDLSTEEQEQLILFRKKHGSYFNKWQSFSYKIMRKLIPYMYEEPVNQMELLSRMGMFRQKKERFADCNSIPKELLTEEIYNPVVRRSIRVTVDVINALIRKYGYPEQIVIEMPRDKNDKEKQKRIRDEQSKNEKELNEIITKIKNEYALPITDSDFRRHKQLALKLKLWNEQEGRCLYSGKAILPYDILHNPQLFEIDHIIPKSISFDNSRSNKVLVYHTENQQKGNTTAYLYMASVDREWDLEKYIAYINELKKQKKISKAKMDKLFFSQDITRQDVLKGFIARNINDTRYASRVVLNGLTDYFRAKGEKTIVKVVRGEFTAQMRRAMRLEKDRERSYSHHAVDAMLICYSQMGYEAYRAFQSEFIDLETGEILDKKTWKEKMGEDYYDQILYEKKWSQVRQNIQKAESEVKYWHKIDRKPNRGLCHQTIRGTRNYDNKVQKINKLDIYVKKDYEKLKGWIKDGKSDKFLMFRKDPRTWKDMLRIMEEYAGEPNPFVAYEKETGDYFRKYAKKHNGPRITKLKYLDGELKSCIDISHKYGQARNSAKVILESSNPYRTDVYYHKEKKQYYLVGLKYSDLKYDKGVYSVDEEKYAQILRQEKMIGETENRADLIRLGYEFQFSLYKNEFLEYEKDGEIYMERFLSRTKPQNRNYIETKPIDAKFEKQHQVGLGKTAFMRKIRVDILGNRYYGGKEKFVRF